MTKGIPYYSDSRSETDVTGFPRVILQPGMTPEDNVQNVHSSVTANTKWRHTGDRVYTARRCSKYRWITGQGPILQLRYPI